MTNYTSSIVSIFDISGTIFLEDPVFLKTVEETLAEDQRKLTEDYQRVCERLTTTIEELRKEIQDTREEVEESMQMVKAARKRLFNS